MEAIGWTIAQAADEQSLDVPMRTLNPLSGGIGSPKSLTEEPDQRVGLTRPCRKVGLRLRNQRRELVENKVAGTTGLERATSDVTGSDAPFR